MHPVESAFRRFKSSNPIFAEVMAHYPTLLRKCRDAVAEIPQVAIPTANFHLALAAAYPRLPQQGMDYVNELAQAGNLWGAYREDKHVYQLTAELARELAKLKQPLTLPAKAIYLPRRGVVLDLTAFLGPDHSSAHLLLAYDALSRSGGRGGQEESRPAIRITRVGADGRLTSILTIPCDLEGKSIWDAHTRLLRCNRDALVKDLADLRAEHGAYPERMLRLAPLTRQWDAEVLHYDRDLAMTPEEFLEAEPLVALAINTLFYLQGDPEVVKMVHPGAAPQKTRAPKHAPNLQKLNRRLDLQEPTTQVVGERFTAAIQHYEIERQRLKAEGAVTGSKAPHLRRPHLHTYRTGADRLDVCLKFLGWIGVGGAEVPKALKEAFVTITPVK